jgi:hypothetical protein
MDVVTTWNGARADALRRALRMSIDEFADRIGVSARTAAYWRQRPDTVPKPTIQAALDTRLAQASESEKTHFRLMLAGPEDRLPLSCRSARWLLSARHPPISTSHLYLE